MSHRFASTDGLADVTIKLSNWTAECALHFVERVEWTFAFVVPAILRSSFSSFFSISRRFQFVVRHLSIPFGFEMDMTLTKNGRLMRSYDSIRADWHKRWMQIDDTTRIDKRKRNQKNKKKKEFANDDDDRRRSTTSINQTNVDSINCRTKIDREREKTLSLSKYLRILSFIIIAYAQSARQELQISLPCVA